MPGSPEADVRRAYAALADRYIELFSKPEQVPAGDLAFVGRHLSGLGGVVLDAGCGPGHLTAHLCSLGAGAFGLDLVPEFVTHARAAHPGVTYGIGSMTALPVADRSVAGVLAYYSLIHTPPPELGGVLAELRRVLAPAGTLVVGFFDGDEVAAFDHKVVTAYRWSVAALTDRLAGAGFTTVAAERRPGDGVRRPQAILAAVAAGQAH